MTIIDNEYDILVTGLQNGLERSRSPTSYTPVIFNRLMIDFQRI